jgi:hypothetical protein
MDGIIPHASAPALMDYCIELDNRGLPVFNPFPSARPESLRPSIGSRERFIAVINLLD